MFLLENNLIDQKGLMRHFNPDITDEELELKIKEFTPEVFEEETPRSPLLAALQNG